MGTDRTSVSRIAALIVKHCHLCQAYKPANHETSFKMKATHIQRSIGDGIAIDVFYMNPAVWEGKAYDCFILAFDRHSGYGVVEPALQKGLTSFVTEQMQIYGVPSFIPSEKGPRFPSNFRKSLCSLMGMRSAYSHADFHEGNVKAERTGKELND